MNYSTAVFLINDDVRAIACTYEADEKAKREIFKTLDKSIAKDDFVVVPTDTRHKMTVVKVVEVDVDVDLDSSIPMQWIVGAVERHDYERILKMEEQAIETIKSAEARLVATRLRTNGSCMRRMPPASMKTSRHRPCILSGGIGAQSTQVCPKSRGPWPWMRNASAFFPPGRAALVMSKAKRRMTPAT